jgi:hypothetical protein
MSPNRKAKIPFGGANFYVLTLTSFFFENTKLYISEYYEQGPEAGLAASASYSAHETCPGASVRLCDRIPYNGQYDAHPVDLVKTNRDLRARPQPAVHGPVDVRMQILTSVVQ